MTITKLIARYKEMNPIGHFFSKDTLKFFGQTLKDLKYWKRKILISLH